MWNDAERNEKIIHSDYHLMQSAPPASQPATMEVGDFRARHVCVCTQAAHDAQMIFLVFIFIQTNHFRRAAEIER